MEIFFFYYLLTKTIDMSVLNNTHIVCQFISESIATFYSFIITMLQSLDSNHSRFLT